MKANTNIQSKEKQMDYSTYRLSFPDGTYYIGSTSNTNNRFLNHKNKCERKRHYNYKVQNAWDNIGEPALQVLNFYSTKEEALEAEQELLNEFYGMEECLNLSSNSISFWTTKEHKAKLRTYGIGNTYNLGKIRSPETRAKMSASLKGKKHSAEHRTKLSLILKGRVHKEETKNKIASSMFGTTNGKGNAGKRKTEEHREKISLALKQKKEKFSFLVVGDKTFSSFIEAGRFYGVSSSALHYALKRGNFRGMRIEKI